MKLEYISNNGKGVIAVQGSIDALTSENLTDLINQTLADGQNRLVIDLSLVNFMGSAGLRAILVGFKDSRQRGGDLHLAAAQPAVEKLLQISGFTNILKSFPNRQEALEGFTF